MNPAKVQPVTEEDGPPTIQAARRELLHPLIQNNLVAVRDEGVGEEKLCERANMTRITLAAAAPAAAIAPLREADDPAAMATTAFSTSAAATADAAATTADTGSRACDSTDTHVVGFEGARDQVIVVAKKATVQLWLVGDEGDKFVNRMFQTFMLTPIFLVSGTLSSVGLVVALLHHVEDRRWYWMFVCGGVWLWLVSLPHTRPPDDVCFVHRLVIIRATSYY